MKSEGLLRISVAGLFVPDELPIIKVKKCPMHYYSFAFYLLLENHRRMKQYTIKKSFAKK
jgi:hypothetical protein